MQEQPSSGDEVVEVAPDAAVRAARNEIRAVADGLRAALAADDALAAGARSTPDEAAK
jgi:hypothetical protein